MVEVGETVGEYVEGLSARARADLGGGRDRLAVLAEGELGRWLDPFLREGPQFDLCKALQRGEVVYFQLDSDHYPAASKLLGVALVIDLVTMTADLQDGELCGLAVLDEFAALAADQVHRLFGRARSAGLSLLLGTESLADLRSARPGDPTDSLTEQVFTNVAYLLVHREADPDSAERLARVAGTEASWATTTKVGGRRTNWWSGPEGTRTPDRQFVVPPDRFKRIGHRLGGGDPADREAAGGGGEGGPARQQIPPMSFSMTTISKARDRARPPDPQEPSLEALTPAHRSDSEFPGTTAQGRTAEPLTHYHWVEQFPSKRGDSNVQSPA